MEQTDEKKQILSVATAHLDTIWNWDFEYVISKCIPKTLNDNFRLFEKYPEYKFNFEGAYRYELMEEYYPELFKRMCRYVREGRWSPCGSSYENGDVNIPSPEALFRNILIGNDYFYKKFGIRTNDIYLPDCFGFGYALPSVAHHADLLGFTTQKLSWGSAYGNPFDMGKWYGADGNYIFGVLRPGSYTTDYSKKKYVDTKNLRTCKFIKDKMAENEKYALDFTVSFQGVGDQGGSPTVSSVEVMHRGFLENGKSDTEVISAFATEPFDRLNSLSDEEKDALPKWDNELVMTYHGVGGYTSRAVGKRWNSRNEILADCAERTACAAENLGLMRYPSKPLETAWKRVIAHHFHDDLPGTSVQRAYKRSWNDLAVSLNQFADEYTSAVGKISETLNTDVAGIPVAVSNTLEFKRTGAVTAEIETDKTFVRVFDGDNEVVSQTKILDNGKRQVIFIARISPLAVKVFSLVPSDKACELSTGLCVGEKSVENENLKVILNDNGEIESIFDKRQKKEILCAPIKLDLFEYFGTREYPAWEIDYKEISKEPEYKAEKVSAEIIDDGAAKVTLKVTEKCDKSTFVFYISLSSLSEFVSVRCETEWRDRHRLMKVRFPLKEKNEQALYDLGLGAIKRSNNTEKLYEVPAQKWADITSSDNKSGVSILSDCKYGWDKPDDNTLRLTVLHTPQLNFHDDSMQSMMDLGLNRFGFAVFPHSGACGRATQKAAREFSVELSAFFVGKHSGVFGREYSFGGISNDAVIIRAIKKAQKTDEIIVRVNEGENREQKNVKIILGDGIVSAREVYASEENKAKAVAENGCLVFDMKPYEIKSFAVKLISAVPLKSSYTDIVLPFNLNACSFNGEKNEEDIGGIHYTLPAEKFPSFIDEGDRRFMLGARDGKNAVLCDGQKIELPKNAKKLYLLASSLYGDREVEFTAGTKTFKRSVAALDERVGGWDLYDLKETAFTKTCPVAYEFTHAHRFGDDIIAKQSYIFRFEFDVAGETVFTLPTGKTVLAFSALSSDSENFIFPCGELFDVIHGRKFTYSMDSKDRNNYRKYKFTSHFRK